MTCVSVKIDYCATTNELKEIPEIFDMVQVGSVFENNCSNQFSSKIKFGHLRATAKNIHFSQLSDKGKPFLNCIKILNPSGW